MVALPKEQPNNDDTLAREYILELKAGKMPTNRPDSFGKWDDTILLIERQFMRCGGKKESIERVIDNLCKQDSVLDALLKAVPLRLDVISTDRSIPELPTNCKANEQGAELASPTLDKIVQFMKYWATRSYEGYFESAAIWLLSTIAARRVFLPWRSGVWTPFYVLFCADSTATAKSEAARLASNIIEACGLEYLLTPDDFSPQKLISNMAGTMLPRNYAVKSDEEKEAIRLKLAFAAQRGWFYDEFGNKIQEMLNPRSTSNMLYGLMKKIYDNGKKFERDTVSRGPETIDMPFLSVIGTATPACLKPIANRNSAVWTDGFFARIAFIVPPLGPPKTKSAPNEFCTVPSEIVAKLTSWHYRLGIPDCQIVPSDESDGDYTILRGDLPQNAVVMPQAVYDAHQLYYESLANVAYEHHLEERYKSNYGRLPDMALRIAMLLASLENNGRMEMKHWARAQKITEQWRANFHELVRVISADDISSYSETEEKVLEALIKLGPGGHTSRAVSQRGATALRTLGSKKVREILDELAESGVIIRDGAAKTANAMYYQKPAAE